MSRLIRQSLLPSTAHVRGVGVEEWVWWKGQRYGIMLMDLKKLIPIDLLADVTAESYARWLQIPPSVEMISRDGGTTAADGATQGAPNAPQIAYCWYLLHNLGEALEKIAVRHHVSLKCAFTKARGTPVNPIIEPGILRRLSKCSK